MLPLMAGMGISYGRCFYFMLGFNWYVLTSEWPNSVVQSIERCCLVLVFID